MYLVLHPDVRRMARMRAVVEHVTEVFSRSAALLGGESPSCRRARIQRYPRLDRRFMSLNRVKAG